MKQTGRAVSQRMQGIRAAGAFLSKKSFAAKPAAPIAAPPVATIARLIVSQPAIRRSAIMTKPSPPPIVEPYQLNEREYLMMNGH